MWRLFLRLFCLLVGLTILGLLLFVAFFDFDEAIEEQKNAYLPKLSALLGRKVTAGRVQSTFWPHLGGRLDEIRVAGPTPHSPPLLSIDRLTLAVDSSDALFSWGNAVRVNGLTLEGVKLNLTRNDDGTYAHAAVLARIRERKEKKRKATIDPEADAFVRGLRLDRVVLSGGRISVTEADASTVTPLDQIHLEFTEVAHGQPYGVHLRAAVGGGRRNVSVSGRLGPTVTTAKGRFTPIHDLGLEFDQIAVGAISPYLGPTHWQWDRAILHGSVQMTDPYGLKERTEVTGELSATGLTIDATEPGPPFEMVVKPCFIFDRRAGRIDLDGFAIELAGMAIRASGQISDMYTLTPKLDGVRVDAEKFDLGRFLQHMPPLGAKLTPSTRLDGPAAIRIRGDREKEHSVLAVHLDLGQAQLTLPDALHKPRGRPFNLDVRAHLESEALRLDRIQLAWGPLALGLRGLLKYDGALDLEGTASSPRPLGEDPEDLSNPETLTQELYIRGSLRHPRFEGPGARTVVRLASVAGAEGSLYTALERFASRNPREPGDGPAQ